MLKKSLLSLILKRKVLVRWINRHWHQGVIVTCSRQGVDEDDKGTVRVPVSRATMNEFVAHTEKSIISVSWGDVNVRAVSLQITGEKYPLDFIPDLPGDPDFKPWLN